MKLVITGGHHSSALPVISELKIKQPNCEFYWIGHRHSLKGDKNDTLEYREITALHIPFYELRTGKIYKVYNPLQIFKVISGFFQAVSILRRVRPDIIVSFGGYLAVPVVMAGYLLGIPSISHEQTLVVGYANKVISYFATKILISWEKSKKYFSGKNVVVTGIPIRNAIFAKDGVSFAANNELPYIFVMGGKSGSHILNMVIKGALPELLSNYNVIHQCGDYSITDDYSQLAKFYDTLANKPRGMYFLRKFIMETEIGEAYARSGIVISRSGAHTLAELIALNKRAILIPIPWVSHNEQYLNAKFAQELGLAKIINEKDLSSLVILSTIEEVSKLPEPKDVNAAASLNYKAASNIADEILSTYETQKNRN